MTFSDDFIFCNLLKYLWNLSFIITLWLPLATACTGIRKVYWEIFLNIPGKIPSASETIIFGSPNGTKKFPKYHHAAWSDVIYFITVSAARPNPVIQSMHVMILRDPFWSGMSSGSQKYRNTISNGVPESIVWSNCCASWEHQFTNWQCSKAIII